MTIYTNIAQRIIQEQELIVGPLAWIEARKVSGLSILDPEKGEISINSENEKEIVDKLVNQYEKLFGLASHEACRVAVASIVADMPPDQIPTSLK